MPHKMITVSTKDYITTLQLNRPEALNALCHELMEELKEALIAADQCKKTRVIVITGNEKAFAAGADIKEMSQKTYAMAYNENFITHSWETLSHVRKPVIAIVQGYALGGGCEIAMMCDFIIAAESAQFSLPEVTIGTLPGAGGTQRLTRAIGKAKAMEMCLTGRMMSAQEAERAGLVAHVFSDDTVTEESLKIASKIATYSLPVLMMIKESIKTSFETPLAQGLQQERRLFHASFALEDQKEGMEAFIEKRKPHFKDQ